MLAAALSLALGWSHNDYARARPLREALEAGACAVEADVHLQDGELRVAHRFWQTVPGRTLQSLYLEPLATLETGCSPLILAVDFKGRPEETLAAVEKALEPLRPRLVPRGPIQVLVSGSIPKELAASRAGELYAVDGRLSDVGRDPKVFPLISAPLPRLWPLTAPGLIRKAHAAGHKLRFWAIRDEPWAWRALAEMGVDYVCTDDPAGYARRSSAARAQ